MPLQNILNVRFFFFPALKKENVQITFDGGMVSFIVNLQKSLLQD